MAITRIFNIFEQDESFIAQIADPDQGQGQSENQIDFEEKYDIQPQSEDHITEWVNKSTKKKVHFTSNESDLIRKMQKLKLKLPSYKSRSCRPGIPVAPRALRFELKSGYDEKHRSVLLRWWPSQIFDEDGEPCQIQKLVGYRIYVNGHPKGMIKPHKNRALVEGLRVQHEYKITVVALGTIGESQHSNAAIIYVPGVELNATRASSRSSRPESAKTENAAIMSAPREVESIDTIIDQIKQKCSSNQALILKVEKAISSDSDSVNKSNEEIPLSKTEKKNVQQSDSSIDSENYEELLDKLDEETDEDVIERVLKRYGLNGDDFNYAKPSQNCSLTDSVTSNGPES